MSFELKPGESLRKGIRRIARQLMDDALDHLVLRGFEPPADGVPSEHVPTRRAAARERFASLLDLATAND